MSSARFDPASADDWIARGRAPVHAALIAVAWQEFPYLASDAPLEQRMERPRERVVAMRPVMETIRLAGEEARQRGNFTFAERRVARGEGDSRDQAIPRARDHHGFVWDASVQYACGWYAAQAGWQASPPQDRGNGARSAAYMLGFRDGGGDPDDLFDAARRSLDVVPKDDIVSPAAVGGRPLPSSWPQPGDAALPTRSSRRLLILGAPEAGMLADNACHAGVSAPLLPLVVADPASEPGLIVIVSGLGFAGLPPPGSRLDPLDEAGAARLSADRTMTERLRALLGTSEFDDILVAAQGPYLELVDAHHRALPLCRAMERTRHSLLLQRAQMRIWLDRFLVEGESRGAGHIRWGKATKGLAGRLGEFTARYTGKVPGQGHRILVETGDRDPATGFVTSRGDLLAWETFISNRAHLRAAMTDRVRAFGGATRLRHERTV